jgi:ribosomal protein L37AE/L43A
VAETSRVICPNCGGEANRRGALGDYVCHLCAAVLRGSGWSIEVSGHEAAIGRVEPLADATAVLAATDARDPNEAIARLRSGH